MRKVMKKGCEVMLMAVCLLALLALPALAGAKQVRWEKEVRALTAPYNAEIAAAKARGKAVPAQRNDAVRHRAHAAACDARWAEIDKAVKASRAKPDQPRAVTALAKLFPPRMVGSAIYALREGLIQKTDSPLEYLLVPRVCRAVNTFVYQSLEVPVGSVLELVTPGSTTQYAPEPGQLGWLTARGIQHGPGTQMFKTGTMVIPPVLVGAGVIVPFAGFCEPGMIATTAAIGAVGEVLLAEAVDAGEKAVTNAMK